MKERIGYDHPEWFRVLQEAEARVASDFNKLRVAVVKKYYDGELYEKIEHPDYKRMYLFEKGIDEILKEYHEINGTSYNHADEEEKTVDVLLEDYTFTKWLEGTSDYDSYESEKRSNNYPTWSTLFEANNDYLSEKLEKNIEMIEECGFGLIAADNDGELNAMLFFTGGGYDFYEAHWVPLFIALGWITIQPKTNK